MHQYLHYRGITEGKEGEKGPEKTFEVVLAKGNSHSAQSPIQDKPKEEHAETQ